MKQFDEADIDNLIKTAALQAAPLFNLFGWTYGDGPPTIRRLEGTIEGLIRNAINEDFQSCSTGRFIVTKQYDEDDCKIVVSLDLGSVWQRDA